MKHELLQMRAQGSGAIVNCSSQSGFVGLLGLSAYTASKHGVIGLTKAALEYVPGEAAQQVVVMRPPMAESSSDHYLAGLKIIFIPGRWQTEV